MQIIEYSKTEAALAELRAKYGKNYDVRTTSGMKEAKAARAEIKGYRVALEKLRVEIKAPALERCKLIDSEAKRITAALEAIENPIDEAIKTEERREEQEKQRAENEKKARADAAFARVARLRNLPVRAAGQASDKIAALVAEANDEDIPGDEYHENTEVVRADVKRQLAEMFARVCEQEAMAEKLAQERAELERLRAEQAKRDAEAKAKIETEERAARERIAEEERQARAARDAADREAARLRDEQERSAREAREREESRLRAEREKLDAERRAEEDRQRKAREEREAEERAARRADEEKARAEEAERQRKASGWLMLQVFVDRYGADEEFEPITRDIVDFLKDAEAGEQAATA